MYGSLQLESRHARQQAAGSVQAHPENPPLAAARISWTNVPAGDDPNGVPDARLRSHRAGRLAQYRGRRTLHRSLPNHVLLRAGGSRTGALAAQEAPGAGDELVRRSLFPRAVLVVIADLG